MSRREHLLPPGLRQWGEAQAGGFKQAVTAFLEASEAQRVDLPALETTAWLVRLADSSKLHVYEEELTADNFACDCCRIVGWQTHPVGTKNWHFIVPAEEGPYSLADPTTLCAITEARARGEAGSSRIALPAPDPDAPHHHQASTIFESKMHRLHGTVHSNGFGHLARLNGREGGSKRASGRQLMQLWDDLCEVLRVREVSTEDVSNKAGMELRVLHAAARRCTWYGQWHYGFGRGGFNMRPQQWHDAIEFVHGAALADVLADFDGIDATVLDILQRYRDPAAAASGQAETLGGLLGRMLGLLSHPDPILPVFEAAAAAERERQRMVAEQRLLMQFFHEQQRQLAAQQAQQPLLLDNGPTAAYFGVSLQQQELARQQQELFALASQPMHAEAVAAMAAAAAAAEVQQAAPEAEFPASEQQQVPAPSAEAAAAERSTGTEDEAAADPEGEAAAPSGEPELRAAAATEAAAVEAADEAAAAAHSIAQAAIAAVVRAVDGYLPHLHPLASTAVAPAVAGELELPPPPPPPVPADLLLLPPPHPPLPAAAAAAAATEVDQWLMGGEEEQRDAAQQGGEGPVEGTLYCRRGAGTGEPQLADASPVPAPAPMDAAGPGADGGVLRLRGGGPRKRAAPEPDADASSEGDGAKRQKGAGGGPSKAGQQGGFGAEVVGRSIMVYWKEEKTYYTGTITAFKNGKHTVKYRDGDVEHLNLENERFKWNEKASVHQPTAAAKAAAKLEAAGGKQGPKRPPKEAAAEAAAAGGKHGRQPKAAAVKEEEQPQEEEAAAEEAEEAGEAKGVAKAPPAKQRKQQKNQQEAEQRPVEEAVASAAAPKQGSRPPKAAMAAAANAPQQQQEQAEAEAAAAPPPKHGGRQPKAAKVAEALPATLVVQQQQQQQQEQPEEAAAAAAAPKGKSAKPPKPRGKVAKGGKAAKTAAPGAAAEAAAAVEEPVAAAAAAAEAEEPMDDDSVAAAVAAAAVARVVAIHSPPAVPAAAAAPAEAEGAPAGGAGVESAPAEEAPAEDGEVPAAALAPAAQAGGLPSTEQLAAAAGLQPNYITKEEVAAAQAAGRLVLGCGSCRYATAGCRRCRPRAVSMLEREGVVSERLQLLGKCGRCDDPQHGCPVCWRMVVLAGDPASVAQVLATGEGGAAVAAARGSGRGKRKAGLAPKSEPQSAEASPAPEAAGGAAAADAAGEPHATKKSKRQQQRKGQADAATAAAAEVMPLASPAQAAPEHYSPEGTPATDGLAKERSGQYSVDEKVKAGVQAARARGEIVLGCGRCRYRVRAGCVDCRHKALLQMRQEGLAEAVAAVGCDMCHHSDQGCRLCWPIAVEVAQKAHAALLPGQRVVMPASPPGPARGAKKDKKGAGGKAAASSPDAVAASVSPAAAAAAAAAASASTRRNKLLLKVQHDTVTAAHEAGKTALGCGRCRYSMTGGCNNCRAKEAEKLRKDNREAAARLGCEHCENGEDGCPHCWKELLVWLGDGAVRAPPTEKVAAAMATPQPEDEAERGQAEGGATASRPAKRQHAGGAKVQQQQQQGAGAAAAAGAPAGEAFKWGNRIAGWRIKVWWSDDSAFYPGRVTSYKQGLHRVVYDEDGQSEKVDLLGQRVQLQRPEGGEWLEYDRGVPVGAAAMAAAYGPAVAAPGAAAAPAPKKEQTLGVAVKDLLQKRVRVLCPAPEGSGGAGQWKEGVVVGYNHGKFAIAFDDGTKDRFFLQQEEWEPLDLELMQQRQQAQRAVTDGAPAPPDGSERAPSPPRAVRAARAAAAPGAYAGYFDEEMGGEGSEGDYSGEWGEPAAPAPAVPTRPRVAADLPEPLPLPAEAEKARKAQYGLHRYVGQRVRVWSAEAGIWREGVITSFGQGRHKVECDDGSRTAFNMFLDACQLLPHADSPSAQPGPLLPAVAGGVGPPHGASAALPQGQAPHSRRLAHLPPEGAPPPKVPRAPVGPPVLPGEALPIFRDRLQAEFVLPPCTQNFGLDKIARVLRLTLAKLKEHPGQWVPKAHVRSHLHAGGIRDNSLMDYCGRAMECATLDGWGVYRNRSPQYNCLYYLAEKVGDDDVLTTIPEPQRTETKQRLRPPAPTGGAFGGGATTGAGGFSYGRQQRRVAGGNVRRGGGALSPRMAAAAPPRRQQPWQMLLPAGVPPPPLGPDECRNQVMSDLVYLFNQVLRQYKPAAFLKAQQAARAAAAAAGTPAADPTPLRTLRLGRLLEEVQVLRDCKHFIKVGSGERFGVLPTPPGMLRLLCHLALPDVPREDDSGEGEPSFAPPVRPPPEVLLLPADATVGQLLDAATTTFRASYRMTAGWTAESVVCGLSVEIPPPPPPLPALPAPPTGAANPTSSAAAAAPAAAAAAGPQEMEVDPASPEAVAAVAAAAAVAAVVGAEAMEVDNPQPAAAAEPEAVPEPQPAAADEEAQLAAAVVAAAVVAVVAAHDGTLQEGVEQQLNQLQLDAGGSGEQQQQQQQAPDQQPAAAQLDPEAYQQLLQEWQQLEGLRQQHEQQRQALLGTRLADVLLPPPQQATSADMSGAAPRNGAGGSAEAARAEAAEAGQLPSVTVAGRGFDWAVRWRHAGGLEDWAVRCRCGVGDDDGERMIMCDSCNVWMHTRCYHIPDEAPVPESHFICDNCAAAQRQPHQA